MAAASARRAATHRGGQPSLSPLMKLAPAPAAALVHAHARRALINLAEATDALK